MARPELTTSQVEDARARIRGAALALYSKSGYSGMTIRAIAEVLDWSHSKPYRYYNSRADIIAAVRSELYHRFARQLEGAADLSGDPIKKIRSMGTVYASFALENPDAHKLIFMTPIEQAGPATPEGLQNAVWAPLKDAITQAAQEGLLSGDPDTIAHVFWASLEGLISLHLAGRLTRGKALKDIYEPMTEILLRGASTVPK